MRRGIHSWCGCAGTAAWHATVKCARHENSGGKPGYSFYKNVHYQGKQVALEVAQAEAALTRKFNAESQNNLCAVEDGKEDGTVDTADECGNYGAGSGTV